jgi:hypothetical protein
MWLKLKGIISWHEYPEQSLAHNDGRGYEPYPDGGTKNYNGVDVHFRKITFLAPYRALFDRLRDEIAEGGYLVLSLRPPGDGPWHGYIATHSDGDDFVVFTKRGAETEEDRLLSRLQNGEKVDCLFMRVKE